MVNIMPSKSPTIFPNEERLLVALGERIRLARKRRKLTSAGVAQRAGLSRTTVHYVERGDPSVTLGAYLRVLAALGLDKDIEAVGAEDVLGRRLQDLRSDPRAGAKVLP